MINILIMNVVIMYDGMDLLYYYSLPSADQSQHISLPTKG